MTIQTTQNPPWLATVLLVGDDTEESVMGSDLHQKAIFEAHALLLLHAEDRVAAGRSPWYVSSQVTVIFDLPMRQKPWRPKPDIFVVDGLPAADRVSYDTRKEGPVPQFILEVASESTWREDVGDKRVSYELAGVEEYVVFDPVGDFLPERILAWRAGANGWQPWTPLERQVGEPVWRSTVLGLDLRVEGSRLRFDDPGRGPLLALREVREQWQAAERERDAERVAREVAERELAELRRRLQQRESGKPDAKF
jgi:Uma2 family endonuclease